MDVPFLYMFDYPRVDIDLHAYIYTYIYIYTYSLYIYIYTYTVYIYIYMYIRIMHYNVICWYADIPDTSVNKNNHLPHRFFVRCSSSPVWICFCGTLFRPKRGLRDQKAHGNAPEQYPQDAHECLNDRHSDDAKGMRPFKGQDVAILGEASKVCKVGRRTSKI